MKKIKYLLLITILIFAFNSCADDQDDFTTNVNFVTFGDAGYSTGVDVGGSATVDIPVYTTNVTSSTRTFNVFIDEDRSDAAPGSYTVPASVTIEGGSNKGTLSVTLSDVDLGIGVNKLVLDFEAVAQLSNGGNTTVSYTQNCNEVSGTLDIDFDYYAEETSWEIIDALGGTVLQSGAYSNGNPPVSESITLCAGRDYTLIFYDAYSDGMNDGQYLGSYTLTIGGVEKVSGGGNFGASESTEFNTK